MQPHVSLLVLALACAPVVASAQVIVRPLSAEQQRQRNACLARAGQDMQAAVACARAVEDGPPAAGDAEPGDATTPPTDAERDFEAIYGTPGYDPVADPTLPPPAQVGGAYDPW